MSLKEQIQIERLPQHIAIIMDGNGRWAKEHDMPRHFGHQNGVKALHQIAEGCAELGVKCLTVYAFSTENWNRPVAEVSGLMTLLGETIKAEMKTLIDNNIQLHFIGDTDRVPKEIGAMMKMACDTVKSNTGMILNVAMSYSGRWEIADVARKIAKEVKEGTMDLDSINEETVGARMTTAGIPDPELLIRTGGEYRISNFLLWQVAYAELYFTNKYWPEFGKEDLYEAIVDYQSRERRFGKTSEQLSK